MCFPSFSHHFSQKNGHFLARHPRWKIYGNQGAGWRPRCHRRKGRVSWRCCPGLKSRRWRPERRVSVWNIHRFTHDIYLWLVIYDIYLAGYPLVYRTMAMLTFLLEKLTISMAVFNSYVTNLQRVFKIAMKNQVNHHKASKNGPFSIAIVC